ncbi:hypothetical protein D3C71_574280 [compost metagenome]
MRILLGHRKLEQPGAGEFLVQEMPAAFRDMAAAEPAYRVRLRDIGCEQGGRVGRGQLVAQGELAGVDQRSVRLCRVVVDPPGAVERGAQVLVVVAPQAQPGAHQCILRVDLASAKLDARDPRVFPREMIIAAKVVACRLAEDAVRIGLALCIEAGGKLFQVRMEFGRRPAQVDSLARHRYRIRGDIDVAVRIAIPRRHIGAGKTPKMQAGEVK